ncbi:hypothetical protein CAEBREN_18522 [Caenorhabditis brenneri]|uniref:Uncharacterized protein n=1 Tax=Caenorhabditis brenneri TaxID=135651 RepID=G0MDD3_CAEBE|nr:hypothetical protein CAEBREN_18522 [Caenorhabditis brenneri]
MNHLKKYFPGAMGDWRPGSSKEEAWIPISDEKKLRVIIENSTGFQVDCEVVRKDPAMVEKKVDYNTVNDVLMEIFQILSEKKDVGHIKKFVILEESVQFLEKFLNPLVEDFHASREENGEYRITFGYNKEIQVSYKVDAVGESQMVFEVNVEVCQKESTDSSDSDRSQSGRSYDSRNKNRKSDSTESHSSRSRSRSPIRRSSSHRSDRDRSTSRRRGQSKRSSPHFSDSDDSRSRRYKGRSRRPSSNRSYRDDWRLRIRDRSRRSYSGDSDVDRSRSPHERSKRKRSRDRSHRSRSHHRRNKRSRNHKRRSDSSHSESDRSRFRSRHSRSRRSRNHKRKSDSSHSDSDRSRHSRSERNRCPVHKKTSHSSHSKRDRSRSRHDRSKERRPPSPKNYLPSDACEPLYREIVNILKNKPNVGYTRKYVLTKNDIPNIAAFVLPLEKRFNVTRGSGQTIISLDEARDIQVSYEEVKQHFVHLVTNYKIVIRVCKKVKKNPNAPADDFIDTPFEHIFDEIDKMICTNAAPGRSMNFVLPRGQISSALDFMKPLEKRFNVTRQNDNVCFVPLSFKKIVRVLCHEWKRSLQSVKPPDTFRIIIGSMNKAKALAILKEKSRLVEEQANRMPTQETENGSVEETENMKKIDEEKKMES